MNVSVAMSEASKKEVERITKLEHSSYYDMLGAKKDEKDPRVFKRCHDNALQKLDLANNQDNATKKAAEFLKKAYETLIDPKKRDEHDKSLESKAPTPKPTPKKGAKGKFDLEEDNSQGHNLAHHYSFMIKEVNNTRESIDAFKSLSKATGSWVAEKASWAGEKLGIKSKQNDPVKSNSTQNNTQENQNVETNVVTTPPMKLMKDTDPLKNVETGNLQQTENKTENRTENKTVQLDVPPPEKKM